MAQLASLLKAKPLDEAAHEAATSDLNLLRAPTERQIAAGVYAKGHWRISGQRITLENAAGTRRRPEWPPLTAHYGYVRGTKGADGDHVDVFIKPGTPSDWAGTVYVIDQVDEDGEFDEHKCMIGWGSQEAAERAYLGNYTKGWVLGVVTAVSWKEFTEWLKGDTTVPMSREVVAKLRSGSARGASLSAILRRSP